MIVTGYYKVLIINYLRWFMWGIVCIFAFPDFAESGERKAIP